MPISPMEAMRQRTANMTPQQKIAGGIIGIIGLALAGVYANEGGYADHKADRGGKTMYGITERVARDEGYRGQMINFPKHCSYDKPICADRIYTERYIDGPGFRPMAEIEPAILYELVDSAVLHGPARPSRWFQGALNGLCDAKLTVDGEVGPRTIQAYQECRERIGRVTLCRAMLDRLDGAQRAFFDAIVLRNPSQRVFYRGWVGRRINNVDRKECRP